MKLAKEEISSKHVGIWIRVSTEDQARGESPEHHEKRARHYAESKGWKIVESSVYHLEGVSGKAVVNQSIGELNGVRDLGRGPIDAAVLPLK